MNAELNSHEWGRKFRLAQLMTMALILAMITAITTPAYAATTVYSPTANAIATGGFATPTDAYSANNAYATEGTGNDSHDFFTYNINLAGNSIDLVEVGYEACGTEKLGIQVSWDGGTSWSAEQVTASTFVACTGAETPVYWDFTSATIWDATTLNNTNFRVRVRHVQQGGAGTNSYDWIPVRITYSSPTLTIGDATSPASKFVRQGATNQAISAFTMQMNSGTDTVTTVTVTGTNMSNASVLRIYQDNNGDREYDAGDTQLGSVNNPTSPQSVTINEAVSTTLQNYIIVYDISGTATDAATMTASITAATVSGGSSIVNNDNADATLTVDASAPTTSDNVPGTWQASNIAVTLTPTDGGSGVASTLWCYVESPATCTPGSTGDGFGSGVSFTITCAAGTACTKNVSFYSTDNAGNVETTKNKTGRIDDVFPVQGASFTATPGGGTGEISVSWDASTDVGSGLHVTGAYKVMRVAGTTPPADCATGTQAYLGILTSFTDGGLTPSNDYAYRLCTYDAVNHESTGKTATAQASTGVSTAYYIINCSQCHDSPPVDTSVRNAPEGTVVGSHGVASHSLVCAACHVEPAPSNFAHRTGYINMNATSINGFTGSYYDKNNNASKETTGVNNDINFAMSSTPTLGTCRTTYCHGTVSPTWGATGTLNCASCHPAKTGASPALAGKHPMHYNSTSMATDRTSANLSNTSTYVFNCGVCHNVDPTSEHVNGSNNGTLAGDGYDVDIRFNISWAAPTTGSFSNGGATTSTNPDGGKKYWTNGTCTNIYCHSSAQNAGGTAAGSYNSPTWTQAGFTCATNCHNGTPATGKHTTHVTTLGYACNDCHNGAGHANPSKHADYLINFGAIAANAGSITYSQGDHAPGAGGYGTCGSTYCHGNYTGGNNATPNWGGTAACGTCHNATAATPPATAAHVKHAGSANLNLACSDCHGTSSLGHENFKVSWAVNTTSVMFGTNARYRNLASGDTGAKAPSAVMGSCANVYCHSAAQNDGGTAAGTYTTQIWSGTTTCTSCHSAVASGMPATGSHDKHINTAGLVCNDCHNGGGPAAGITIHVNRTINIGFLANAGSASPAYTQGSHTPGGGGYSTCTNVICHSAVQADGGTVPPSTYGTPTWGSGALACSGCHGTPATGKHTTHVSAPLSYVCNDCHNGGGDGTANHGNNNIEFGVLAANATTITYGQSGALGNNYSTCANTYCHGNYTGGNNATPNWGGTAACGTCHNATAATPPATAAHVKHAGSANLNMPCFDCHGTSSLGHENFKVSWAVNTTSVMFGTNARYRNLASGDTGAKAPSAVMGSCANVYCHSAAQNDGGTAAGAYTTQIWSGTTTCTSCHSAVASGMPATGRHATHVTTYGYVCNDCHNNGGPGAGIAVHVNRTINIGFIANAGASAAYTQGSHTPGSGGYGSCNNTNCHGLTTPTWGTTSGFPQCKLCHGVQAAGATKDEYAPGYNTSGVDTGGVALASDQQVGAHDVHLRGLNAIVNSTMVQCEDCHNYPAAVTTAGHIDTYDPAANNRATITFTTTAHSFNSGSYAAATYTCSNAYCHGGAMPKGDTSGTGRTPVWNDTAYLTATPNATNCGKCHGAPPTAGTTSGTHSGKGMADCRSCHPDTVLDTTGNIDTAGGKHINGTIEAQSGCTGCHGSATGTVRNVAADFALLSRHVLGDTPSDMDCIVCHAEGSTASTSASVATTTEHNDNNGPGITIAMRNVDVVGNPGASFVNPGTAGTDTNNFWRWPGPAGTPNNNDHSNMDKFCMRCHDSDASRGASGGGASGLAVKADGTGLTTTPTVAERLSPFEGATGADCLDSTGTKCGSNSYFLAAYERTAVNDAYGAFNPANPSHHAVRAKAYNGNNAGWGTAAWASRVLKNGSQMTTVRENTLLHCADCHAVDVNAHGSANGFMLQAATIDATCWLCHNSNVYSATAAAGSRFDHSNDSSRTMSPANGAKIGDYTGSGNGSNCLLCHGGFIGNDSPAMVDGYGGIHGLPSGNDTRRTGQRFRFIGGNYMAPKTADWASSPTASQTMAAGSAYTCYFDASDNTMNWATCTQHSGTKDPKVSSAYSRGTPGTY